MKIRALTYTLFILACSMVSNTFAQKAERDYLRKGNRQYHDSAFVDAEVSYRKALEAKPTSAMSRYNLGNALLFQNKPQEAMKEFEAASKMEHDKGKLASIYHNAGVILQGAKQYQQAIEAYKESLRNNPADHETRYNLALCQKLLKDQEQQGGNNDQNSSSNNSNRKSSRSNKNNRINNKTRTRCRKKMQSNCLDLLCKMKKTYKIRLRNSKCSRAES